jgi:carbonic anhydrase
VRLFEAIIATNHRAVAGDNSAGLRSADFADELPVIALTCIDPRLNALFPDVLGLPGEQFIWLRNAGNIIFEPMSSMMRSLSLACAVKGGKEIAIIGHTDCLVCKTTATQLLEKLKTLGVERGRLPENLNEFFGLFSAERQNIIKACELTRQSPLIGSKIPVHGLLVDTDTGKLDWVVNGYEVLQRQL